MVKGVRKQIVEIVNTENEYFEKAILFVSPVKSEHGQRKLGEEADLFAEACLRGGRAPGPLRRGRRTTVAAFLLGAVCGAGGTALFFLL